MFKFVVATIFLMGKSWVQMRQNRSGVISKVVSMRTAMQIRTPQRLERRVLLVYFIFLPDRAIVFITPLLQLTHYRRVPETPHGQLNSARGPMQVGFTRRRGR